MTAKTLNEAFTETVLFALKETFEDVGGMYLDKGTSLFETLETISAEEASRPVSPTCASIAAQVAHIRFYLEMTMEFAHGRNPGKLDWGEIWRTVREVTPEEWEASKAALRTTYDFVVKTASTWEQWNDDAMGGVVAILMHTAYHLGEIRQALCTLRT